MESDGHDREAGRVREIAGKVDVPAGPDHEGVEGVQGAREGDIAEGGDATPPTSSSTFWPAVASTPADVEGQHAGGGEVAGHGEVVRPHPA